jgi:hypothetical protein
MEVRQGKRSRESQQRVPGWLPHRRQSFNCDVNTTIEEEYFIRLEVRDDIRSGFEEWKRGYWAARNQLILIHGKKKANAKSAKKSDSK